MSLEMVLNELSLRPADDVLTARQWMSSFIQTIVAATTHGVDRVVRTPSSIFELSLAPDYPLRRWLNDREVGLEEKRYIKSLTAKAPFWDELPDLYDKVLNSEFRYNGQTACGLGVAYLLDSLAISLPSRACWNIALLTLEAMWINETNDSSQIEEATVQVIHASSPTHVKTHKDWFPTRRRADVGNWQDLWDRRDALFPALMFCEVVGHRIQGLDQIMLRPIVRRLFELQTYCQGWGQGPFNPNQMPTKTTPESQATLDQYGKERTFRCPDGVERTFSWHVRVTPGAWRIHYFPGPKAGTMFIGYVGPHLPTVKYN